MPATLIVEDGSGVTNANSYETVAGVRAYALNRGIVLSAVDNDVIVQLITACDYLESFADQYVGQPVLYTQALSWPRQMVQFDPNTPFPTNAIPTQLIQAQDEAVIAIFQGITLQPDVDYSGGGYLIEAKVGPIISKYSEKIGTTSEPILPKVMAKLKMLLNPGVALRTVRV